MPHTNPWQPHLFGTLICLRPLVNEDFESLYAAASDPLIWEQHPDRERYRRERFLIFFDSGIQSNGALIVIDLKSGAVIGTSRFTGHRPETSSIEIGYTFLTREHWGRGYNRELKQLMLSHAFQWVETAFFVVGKANYRSQKAMVRNGGILITDAQIIPADVNLETSVVYQIKKSDFLKEA